MSAKRGRPSYSRARLMMVRIAVELERHRVSVATGKPCSVDRACKSLEVNRARFHGTLDADGVKHFTEVVSADTLRGAYIRAGGRHHRLIGVAEFCTRVTGAKISEPDALAMLKRWGIPVQTAKRRPCYRVDPAYTRSAQAELALEKRRG